MPTDAAGEAFLKAKAKEEGVVKLNSGLLYKVLESGAGRRSPGKTTQCDCHYVGQIIRGQQPQEFDSSYKRGKPLTFAPAQVIPGWTEALQLMKEGDTWEVYMPSNLGYGDDGTPGGPIPPRAALVFHIQLLKVHDSS
mmetsp:Transcript_28278/g.45536  ORF Transcript_28278/g.45536 Transcript_28278/m.45536 type:complete len:138 (+) Transcript_28278:62-475(+)